MSGYNFSGQPDTLVEHALVLGEPVTALGLVLALVAPEQLNKAARSELRITQRQKKQQSMEGKLESARKGGNG